MGGGGGRWKWGLEERGREKEAESTTASDSLLVAAVGRPFCSGGFGGTDTKRRLLGSVTYHIHTYMAHAHARAA